MPKQKFKPLINKSNWLDDACTAKIRAEVRPYSMKELRAMYRMTYRSFVTCLRPVKDQLGERPGLYYTVWQVEIIFMQLGIPYLIKENE